jgi:hypothetical protein
MGEILCLLLNSARVLTLISKHNFPLTIGIISLPLLCLLIYICLVHEILPIGGYIPKMQCWACLVLGSLFFWDAPILGLYPIHIKHWNFFSLCIFLSLTCPKKFNLIDIQAIIRSEISTPFLFIFIFIFLTHFLFYFHQNFYYFHQISWDNNRSFSLMLTSWFLKSSHSYLEFDNNRSFSLMLISWFFKSSHSYLEFDNNRSFSLMLTSWFLKSSHSYLEFDNIIKVSAWC